MLRLSLTLSTFAVLLVSAIAACSSSSDNAGPATSPAADGGDSTPVDDASAESDASAPGDVFSTRPYAVKKSSKYDGSTAVPLLLSLHGYIETAALQDTYMDLTALAEDKNLIVAEPNGTKDPLGHQFWNADDACCDFYKSGVDDVGYLKAVIADVKAHYKIDPKRVFVLGHSNGGFMAHRLACDLSDEIAGIVSLAGAVYADASKCKPTHPVAVLQVHGDADQTVVYDGGSWSSGWPAYPGAKTTVATWAAKNGCDATLTTTQETRDLDTKLDGAETTTASHSCTQGAAELWTIVGAGHIPNLGASWGPAIYDFLQQHPKP